MSLIFNLIALILVLNIPRVAECTIKQAKFRRSIQQYLANHVFQRKQTGSELECSMYCSSDESCTSVNYKISGIDKGLCELNSKTLKEMSDAGGIMNNPEFNHLCNEV